MRVPLARARRRTQFFQSDGLEEDTRRGQHGSDRRRPRGIKPSSLAAVDYRHERACAFSRKRREGGLYALKGGETCERAGDAEAGASTTCCRLCPTTTTAVTGVVRREWRWVALSDSLSPLR